MWQTALDGCGGDPRCAATQLATQLMGIMTREEAMAQFPQLRPGALGVAPGPQMSPTAEKPGFFSRVGSGIVDWASRNVVEPAIAPSAPASPTPIAAPTAQAPVPAAPARGQQIQSLPPQAGAQDVARAQLRASIVRKYIVGNPRTGYSVPPEKIPAMRAELAAAGLEEEPMQTGGGF